MAFQKLKSVPAENSLNAVIYARYSSTQQTENSIDGQLRECNRFADLHGYRIIGSYIDRAKSGTSVDERTEFLRMIDDAKKQQFAYIIVYRFDRFARNRYDSVIYKKQLAAVGVRVLSTAETVGDGDEAIILESIYEAMDEAYSRRLSTITKRGLKETARKNLWTTAAPFGYHIVGRQLEILPPEADGVKMIFEKYLEGSTKKEIADELNKRGLRTKQGKNFDFKKLESILRNRTYTGVSEYMGIERTCPALITADMYAAVQAKLQANSKMYGRKTEITHYALCGKIYCGYCGLALIGDAGTSRNGTRYNYYSCPGRKKKKSCRKKAERQDFIEWYICEQTLKYVLTDKRIKEIAAKVEELAKAEQDNSELKEAERRRSDLNRQLDELTEKFVHTKSQRIIDRLNEQADDLDKQLTAVEENVARLRLRVEHTVSADQVESYLKSFKTGDLLNENFRERLINTLIQCVYLYDDKIIVYFNIKGAKSITHLDAIRDFEALAGSDSSDCGELELDLSEHAYMICAKGVIGCMIKIER
jgi:site-specific DNA recombinase